MSKFIGYTLGLECNGHGRAGKMVKVEYSRNEDGTVVLAAVSGNNLASLNQRKTITAGEFEARPTDAYSGISEARWALGKLGYSLMSDDFGG